MQRTVVLRQIGLRIAAFALALLALFGGVTGVNAALAEGDKWEGSYQDGAYWDDDDWYDDDQYDDGWDDDDWDDDDWDDGDWYGED